jgi:Xaa-Pro aminopeptidase
MTPEEIAWFDTYHDLLHDKLMTLVDEPTRLWLDGACAPLTKT